MDSELNQWWLDLFNDLERAETVRELFLKVAEIAGQLGFAYSSYGIRFASPLASANVTVLDSYPAGWMDHYVLRDYIQMDPTVSLGARSNSLIVWSDRLFADAPSLWDEARDFGLRVGLAQSAWGVQGSFGLLSLARNGMTLTNAELIDLRPRVRWLAETTHQRMQKLLLQRECRGVELTDREHEVLAWTAEGKTSWEISQILRLSESTVNFHVRRILAKLGAQNRVQAAVKATALGILRTLQNAAPYPRDDVSSGPVRRVEARRSPVDCGCSCVTCDGAGREGDHATRANIECRARVARGNADRSRSGDLSSARRDVPVGEHGTDKRDHFEVNV